MTLTLVRHSYPRELIKALRRSGFTVDEKYSGIYHVNGKINIKVQIIVSSRLPDGEYEGLRLLAKGCTKDDVYRYFERAMVSKDENIKTNAGTVMRTCLNANKNLKEKIKEDEAMRDAIREIFSDDFEAAEERGIQKGRQEGRQEGIQEGRQKGIQEGIQEGRQKGVNEANERFATDMLRNGEPLEKIKMYTRLAEDTIRSLAKSLGVAVM